jgi:diguanylate cyclase (GGDEF)-like protein
MAMARRSLGISSRFTLVVIVLVPSLGVVGWAGIRGLQTSRSAVNSLYHDHLVTTKDSSSLAIALQEALNDGLRLAGGDNAADRHLVTADLAASVSPQVEAGIQVVGAEVADDPAERSNLAAIATGWGRFGQLVASGSLSGATDPAAETATDTQLVGILTPATAAAKSVISIENAQAATAYNRALAAFDSASRWMILALLVALLATACVVGWLIRSVLRRTLAYSAFAADVTSGDFTRRLEPTGGDELADLGRTLDDLARRRQADDLYERRQLEFADVLQVAESEQETHNVVKRHLERAVTASTFTVLNRNNSADRLQAMTVVAPDSPLVEGLDSAKPRSCLAVRLGRPHSGNSGEDSLLSCPVCAGCPGRTTCTPLLVSGEVIGSILANHSEVLDDHDQRAIRDAVAQAAPVLGNLRNLAIAQLRAATDSLTGLPNKRGIQDTLKRMVAQSSRSLSPLAALMCDLDHFKTINDRYGHSCGDDVLAAVGALFPDTLRAGDFSGRYGGEEFLILLPATDTAGALAIAEKIRTAVTALRVPSVDQPITLSIGVAVIPDHAIDADTLARSADRALYIAKGAGRNRVEVASQHRSESLSLQAVDAP